MSHYKTKVAFVASSGGHLEEISRLKEIEKKYDCFLVTEKSDFEVKGFCNRHYYVPQMNRKQAQFLIKFIYLFFRTTYILIKEKPDFIITTGALIAYPFCVVGKLLGSKVIYVESFARVTHPSMTGRLVYNLSDLFMVQWEDMLANYPKSMLGGEIF
jgi:UDP-N-acetylglucosamine:LPS N-acetylglucosamine transferase